MLWHDYNLEWDPAKDIGSVFAGLVAPNGAAAGAFLKTLAMEPPIKPGTPDPYVPPKPGELL